MKSVIHRFLKGINLRFNENFSDEANRLNKLQNARLVKRGETGFISRIKGYLQLLSPNKYINPLYLIAVEGQVNTSDYRKGYRLKFVDRVNLSSVFPFQPLAIFVGDDFFVTVTNSGIRRFSDSVLTNEFVRTNTIPQINLPDISSFSVGELFGVVTIPKVTFVESVETLDTIQVPNTFIVDFVETVQVRDKQQDKNSIREFFEAVLN